MFSLADHLDCKKLMDSCVAAIEASQGQEMLSATHGSSGALHWLLLSEKYKLVSFQARYHIICCMQCQSACRHCLAFRTLACKLHSAVCRCIAFVADYFTWLKDDPQLLQLQPQTFKLLCDALLVTQSRTGSWRRHGPERIGGTQMNYRHRWVIEYTCCNSCPGHGSQYFTPGDIPACPPVIEVKLGGKLVCQGLQKRFPALTVSDQPKTFQEMVCLMTQTAS